MNNLKKTGRTLMGVGAITMILFGIIFLLINRLTEIGQLSGVDLHSLNVTLANYTLGVKGWSISGFLTIIAGIFGIYGYFSLKHLNKKQDMAFTWGTNGVILGLIGGTIGGFIILCSGIILILDYFHKDSKVNVE